MDSLSLICEPPICLARPSKDIYIYSTTQPQEQQPHGSHTHPHMRQSQSKWIRDCRGGCVLLRTANGFLIKRRGGYRFYFEYVTTCIYKNPKSTCAMRCDRMMIIMQEEGVCVCVFVDVECVNACVKGIERETRISYLNKFLSSHCVMMVDLSAHIMWNSFKHCRHTSHVACGTVADSRNNPLLFAFLK